MKDPRTVFEALMRTNGHTNFDLNDRGVYVVPGIQTRWKYFLLGWEMRGLQ